ncbi:MAG: hypothetical protein LBM25_03810 [Bacteroidales bacterium]|jgi:antitoxin component YwqK of YwqJK toxin-antitoxin module|nr:hypothetical protein [Bacteroidales bacterium]
MISKNTKQGIIYCFILFTFSLIIGCKGTNKEVISTYENGNPKKVYYTKQENGNKIKVKEVMYYENGYIRYEGAFLNGERTGVWMFYFENGTLFALADFTNNSNGNNWEVYKTDKTVIAKKSNKVKTISFFSDGCLALIRIINDRDEETEYKFYPSFNISQKALYKNGKYNGEVIALFNNGRINSKNFFKEGLQDSIYNLYYENGNIQVEGQYNKGEKIGVWKYFNEDGSLKGEEEYALDGSIIKALSLGIKYYDKEGKEIKM